MPMAAFHGLGQGDPLGIHGILLSLRTVSGYFRCNMSITMDNFSLNDTSLINLTTGVDRLIYSKSSLVEL